MEPATASTLLSSADERKAYSTLDSLLEETKVKEETFSLQEISSLSQDDSVIDIDDDGLTDEQKKILQSIFVTEEQQIQGSHPGKIVLDNERCGCLFDESVSPAACGVISAEQVFSVLFVNRYQPEVLLDLLSSNIISLTYEAQPSKVEIQRWLLFLMSIHSNCSIVRKCEEQLQQILQWQLEDILQKKTAHSYAPSIMDICNIFVNWGADKEEILFQDSTICFEEVLPFGKPVQSKQGANAQQNFKPVFNMLSQWLQARPNYSVAELNQLLFMICYLCLDPTVGKEPNYYEVQVCLASIMQCYTDDDLIEVLPCLCRKLSDLSNHHHDQVFLCHLFPLSCPSTARLQQQLAYFLLYTALMGKEPRIERITDLQIIDLCPLVRELHKIKMNIYHMSSLVNLLDLSVGVVGQDEGKRKQLSQVLKDVQSLMSDLRDSIQHMDDTKVKGMLMHLCFKWEIAVKASHLRQKTIFSCFASSAQSQMPPLQVEQLHDRGSQVIDFDSQSLV